MTIKHLAHVTGHLLKKENDMICPLLMATTLASSQPTDYDCREDECAWYNEYTNLCAIKMVAVDMERTVSYINDVCLTLNAHLGNLNENLIKR